MTVTTVAFKSKVASFLISTPFGWAAVAIVLIMTVGATAAFMFHEYCSTERARLGREQELRRASITTEEEPEEQE